MTALEVVITVALIGAFLGIAVVQQRQMIRRARELALKADLQCLRAGIEFFRARRGRLPLRLDEVIVEPIGRAKFSAEWRPLRQPDGTPLDAFGRPYRYDPATGTVSSMAPDYERW
jgi:type II secretory pathway pseudopilin PulG